MYLLKDIIIICSDFVKPDYKRCMERQNKWRGRRGKREKVNYVSCEPNPRQLNGATHAQTEVVGKESKYVVCLLPPADTLAPEFTGHRIRCFIVSDWIKAWLFFPVQIEVLNCCLIRNNMYAVPTLLSIRITMYFRCSQASHQFS